MRKWFLIFTLLFVPYAKGDWSLCSENFLNFYGDWRLGNRPFLKGNIATLGLFHQNQSSDEDFLLFTDFQYSLLQKRKSSFTCGIGTRHFYSNYQSVLGLNAYIDTFKSNLGNYIQLGWGFEYFSKFFDIRGNGYFPLIKKKSRKEYLFDNYKGDYIVSCKLIEKALSGFDLEFGKRFCCFHYPFAISPALGCYYLNGNCERVIGGMGRLGLDWKGILNLETRVYRDHSNKTSAEIILGFNFPIPECFNQPCLFSNSSVKPIRRSYICIENRCKYSTNY